jgi:hypothetical protein
MSSVRGAGNFELDEPADAPEAFAPSSDPPRRQRPWELELQARCAST